jgi:hypothetical protein
VEPLQRHIGIAEGSQHEAHLQVHRPEVCCCNRPRHRRELVEGDAGACDRSPRARDSSGVRTK